jgi:molecular chaperone GrpE
MENEMNEELNEKEQQQEQGAEQANTQSDPAMELEAKFSDLNDKYLRLHAEFDNFRRRTNKEKLETLATANAGVLKDLIPVLDDFERAIVNNDKVDDIVSVREGFHLIYNKFKGVLESKGLKPMEVVGHPFDSELHEAIANVPAADKASSGKVLEAVENGYYLNEKVIRYAKVVVSQ